MINLGNVVGLLKSTTAPTKKYVIWAKILNPSFPDIVELNYWDETSLAWIPVTDPTAQYWLRPVLNILSAPPGSPIEGDRYLIGSSASGAWAGKEDQVATYRTGAWQYQTPLDGFIVSNRAEVNKLYDYRGTYGSGGAWYENDFQVPVAPNQYIATIEKGSAGGVVPLNAQSKIDNTYLNAEAFVYTPQNPGQWAGGTATVWSALEQLRTLVSTGAAYTFTNGLDNTGGTVKWKGPLTESTLITHNDKYIFFENASVTGISSSFGITATGTIDVSVYSSSTDKQIYYQLSDGTHPIFIMGAEDLTNGYTASMSIASFNGAISFYSDFNNATFTVDYTSGAAGSIDLLAQFIFIGGDLSVESVEISLLAPSYIFSNSNNISGTSAAFPGLRYSADFSANYVPRSLVDKAYVDSVVGSGGGWSTSGTTTLIGDAYIAGGYSVGFGGYGGDPYNRLLDFELWTSGDIYIEQEFVNGTSTYYNALYSVASGSPSNSTTMNFSATRTSSGITQQASYNAQVLNASGSVAQMKAQHSVNGYMSISIHDQIGGGMIFASTLTGFKGAQYSADFSANYTDRSLVDKGYVASVLGTGITAINGLTKVGSFLLLGGPVAEDTILVGGMDSYGLLIDVAGIYGAVGETMMFTGDVAGGILYTYNKTTATQSEMKSVNGNYVAKATATTAISNATFIIEAQNLGTGVSGKLYLGVDGNNYQWFNGSAYSEVLLGLDTFQLNYQQPSLLSHIRWNSSTTDKSITISGTALSGTWRGMIYAADYSASFTDRSLVDKGYVVANLLGLPLAAPGAGEVGKSIRWNAGGTAWEYFTPGTGGGGWAVIGTTTLTGHVTIEGNFNKYFTGTGNFGIGTNATASYKLDLRNTNALHITNGDNDEGMYLQSGTTDAAYMSGGAYFNGSNWVAKAVKAVLFGGYDGAVSIYVDTGLTVGNSFTPTERLKLTSSGMGLGVSPLAKLHARGNGTTTDAVLILEDSAGTERFKILDYGRITSTTSNLALTHAFTHNNSISAGGIITFVGATTSTVTIGDGAAVFTAATNYSSYLYTISTASYFRGLMVSSSLALSASAPRHEIGQHPDYGSGGDHVFGLYEYNGSTRAPIWMVTTQTGLFGIGLRTATAKLQVKGNGTTSGELFKLQDSASTERFKILDSGTLTASGTVYTFTSDLITAGGSADGAFRFIDDTGIDSAGREIMSIYKKWSGGGAPDTNNSLNVGFYLPNSSLVAKKALGILVGMRPTAGAEYTTFRFVGLNNGTANTNFLQIDGGTISIGVSSQVIGTGDIAIGPNAKTNNTGGTSIGYNAGNTSGTHGYREVSIGYDANAGTHNISDYSVAIGFTAKGRGQGNISLGAFAGSTTGTLGNGYGVSIGYGANSSGNLGQGVIAIGLYAQSNADGAITMGHRYSGGSLTNSTANSFAVGWDATTPDLLFAKTADMYINNTTGGLVLGGTSVNASAKFQIDSTTKGFLPPRMTATQAEAISSPAEGLIIYSTNGAGTTITSLGWWGYNGTTWQKLN